MSFAHSVAKLFIPGKRMEIALTCKPYFAAVPGEEFQLCGHKFFYRPSLILEAALYAASFIPVIDCNTQKDRIELIKKFRSNYSGLLAHTNILYNNDSESIIDTISLTPNSDERLVEMITQGPGALLIEKHTDDIFKIDLNDMSKYKVRDGFIPYGGCLYFNQNYELLSIKYSGILSVPGDNNWEKFKFIFKSSILVKTVIKMHACEYHIIYGSVVSQSILLLNDKNSIKTLMLPYIYQNLESAELAKTVLFGENRYFHRLFAFTFESLEKYTTYCFDNFRHETFFDYKNRLSNENILNSPYFQDASDVIMSQFDYTTQHIKHLAPSKDVDDFVKMLKCTSNKDRFNLSSKDVPAFLANYMFIGSVNHELIGNTVLKWDYDPCETSLKLRANTMQADEETYEQELLISFATTMTKVPMLMDKIENQSKYYYDYLDSLSKVCDVIEDRNSKRNIPFFGAYPKKLESTFSQ